jgi:hypothetical protein
MRNYPSIGDRLVGLVLVLAVVVLPLGNVLRAETGEGSAAADPVGDHLQRGQAYLDKGEYANAVLEFEQVLRFDNLPPDLRQQAEIYAEAAQRYSRGERLSAFGYAETGGGYYRENETRSTRAVGEAARDWFWKARVGGGMSYIASGDLTLDGTLDYRYRYYDDEDRRDDSDLRWSATLTQSLAAGSQSIGVRGRASYRGDPGYRQDYGLFANRNFQIDADNRITVAGEIRRRDYPEELKERSRDTGEVWLGWTRSLMDGRAAVTLTANAGRQWATNDRPDGDANFYGVTVDWGMDVDESLSVFLFGMWEHNAYHDEHLSVNDDLVPVGSYTRSDDLYELEAGLTWTFAPSWSLRPSVLWVRDDSNTLWGNYSSTEVLVTVRKSF